MEWIESRVRRYLGMEQYVLADWGPRMLGWVEAIGNASFLKKLHRS